MEHIKICIHVTKFDLSQVQFVYVFLSFSTKNANYLQNSVRTHVPLWNTIVYLSTFMLFFFKEIHIVLGIAWQRSNTGMWYIMRCPFL